MIKIGNIFLIIWGFDAIESCAEIDRSCIVRRVNRISHPWFVGSGGLTQRRKWLIMVVVQVMVRFRCR